MSEKVVLIGFMGVGKSTVAKHLARILNCKKIDLDDYIEKKEKLSPAEIINLYGEKFFREIETKYLKEVLERDVKVIALGGGTWAKEQNRELIVQSGCITVWLISTFEQCWLNIRASKKKRPLAEDRRKAEKLFAEREKLYCLADWHIPVPSHVTAQEIAQLIAEAIFKKETS